jgi:hypothetical protein
MTGTTAKEGPRGRGATRLGRQRNGAMVPLPQAISSW